MPGSGIAVNHHACRILFALLEEPSPMLFIRGLHGLLGSRPLRFPSRFSFCRRGCDLVQLRTRRRIGTVGNRRNEYLLAPCAGNRPLGCKEDVFVDRLCHFPTLPKHMPICLPDLPGSVSVSIIRMCHSLANGT